MALVKPLMLNSLSVKQWFQHIFLYDPKKFNQGYSAMPEVHQALPKKSILTIFKHHLDSTFLEVYGFDGLDEVTKEITTAEGQINKETGKHYTYDSDKLPWKLAVMSFFGIPNRIKYIEVTDKSLVIDGRQVAKNFVGGLNEKAGEEKLFWQNLASFTIKPFIFIIKSALIFFKTPLNILKLPTEFLTLLIWRFSEETLNLLDQELAREWATPQKDTGPWLLKGIKLFAEGLGLALLGVALASSRILSIAIRAVLSPTHSAKAALGFGRTLENKWLGWIVGILALVASIAFTLTVWAIGLSLIIGAVTTLIPATIPLLTALSKLPVIAASIGFIKGSLASISIGIGAAFGPSATAVGALFGLKISVNAIAVGATFGVIVAPTATFLSWGADKFSNSWADWVEGGLTDNILKAIVLSGGYTKVAEPDEIPLQKQPQPKPGANNSTPTTPSGKARSAVKKKDGDETVAGKASHFDFDDSTELGSGKKKAPTPVKPHVNSFKDDDSELAY
ncbi:MAG: hypothetical protein K2X50_05380 [Gammaproteobacteria bacterium]|nr:hypothetical protein [Gammaproteobacteria bacterium]